MKIELLYANHCPNVDAARNQLRLALDDLSLPQVWDEWEVSDSNAPHYAKRFGSPTILVNERDIANFAPVEESVSCRVYSDEQSSFQRVPSVKMIKNALLETLDDK